MKKMSTTATNTKDTTNMTNTTTASAPTPTTAPPGAEAVTERVRGRVVGAALLVALARLALWSGIFACLVVVLLNAIVDALVYTIAGVIALFWSSCSVLTLAPGPSASGASHSGAAHIAAPSSSAHR